MRKLKLLGVDEGKFMFSSNGTKPSICYIWDMHFPDVGNVMNLQIDWVVKGHYSNGQRKKMVKRTITSLLRKIVTDHKHTLKKVD